MPIYGENKTRQMLRSILPSTSRKSARENKRNLAQANRRPIKHKLDQYRYAYNDEAEEIWDGDNTDYWWDNNPHVDNWGWIIRTRRDHDKLGHFEKWAAMKTRDLEPEERLEYFRSLLPDNLIGRHALSHLRFLETMQEYNGTSRRNYNRRYRSTRDEARQQHLAYYIDFLTKVCTNGLHSAWNRWLKAKYSTTYRVMGADGWSHYETGCPYKMFMGYHDIESYAEYLGGMAHNHLYWHEDKKVKDHMEWFRKHYKL